MQNYDYFYDFGQNLNFKQTFLINILEFGLFVYCRNNNEDNNTFQWNDSTLGSKSKKIC